MCFYGLATYLVIIVSFNLPFLMKEYKFTSGNSGLMISLFFLAIMAPGFILNQIVDLFKQKTKFVSLLAIALGMALILISRTEWLIGLGCIFIGFGYGVIQPIAYDKTTRTAIPESYIGISFRDGDELFGDITLSVYYRFLPVYAPCQEPAIRVYF